MQIIIGGNSLKVKEANQLLKAMFLAVIINNGTGDEQVKKHLEKEETPPPGGSKENFGGKDLVTESKGKTLQATKGELKTKVDPKDICHFYATNKCKFGKDCRREHPKICIKLKKFGLTKFNNKNGCTEDWENYHPKACFESLKTKTCKRQDVD